MPSPFGHGLAGLTVHVLSARDRAELGDGRRAALITGAAMAADLDLLLRFVDGRNHHQAETHSVGFAILAALGMMLLARIRGWPRADGLGLAAGLAWLSHVALDYLGHDTHPPIGLMALWPFVPGHFHFPWPVFLDIGRTLDWQTIRHNSLAVAWEATVLLPMLAASWRRRSRREV